jgi:signal peptidase I
VNTLKDIWRQHRGFALFIGLMFVFRSAVADWNYVPSSSMNPTLVAGDRVVVNKLAYSVRVPFTLSHVWRWSSPQRGDVITFDSPRDDVNLIKRVVAVAGDVVQMRDNRIFINGQEVRRRLLDDHREIPTEAGVINAEIWREEMAGVSIDVARIPAFNRYRNFDSVQVPAGHVMVLGDSRDNSLDSRLIGFVDVNRVTGQAARVLMSHNPERLFVPRANRWWLPMHDQQQS